jgi:hypothetical protein
LNRPAPGIAAAENTPPGKAIGAPAASAAIHEQASLKPSEIPAKADVPNKPVSMTNSRPTYAPAQPLGVLDPQQSLNKNHLPVPPSGTSRKVELAQQASQVEREVNKELKRLVPLLNLTEDQQNQVFARLAQHSSSWVPGVMSTSVDAEPPSNESKANATAAPAPAISTAPATPKAPEAPAPNVALTAPPTADPVLTDILLPVLTPEQETALLQDQLDRAEWWDEVITSIEANLSAETTGANIPETPIEVEGSGGVID